MPLLHRLRKIEKERGGDPGPRIFPPRRQRPAESGPTADPRALTGGTVSLILLRADGESPFPEPAGTDTFSKRHQGGGAALPQAGSADSRPGWGAAAPASGRRPSPSASRGAAPVPHRVAPRNLRVRARGLGAGAPSGRRARTAPRPDQRRSAPPPAPLRAPGRARGGGDSARPCPPPAKAKRAPALTSCSEQRKISVQRPVQQPMVAAGEPPLLLRFFPPALARPRRRAWGSPHPDGAAGRACIPRLPLPRSFVEGLLFGGGK
ncbi:unnamed protein product [Coccothraustes coccothraustes]